MPLQICRHTKPLLNASPQDIWDKRHETVNNFLSIEETAKQACAYNRAEHENKPLVIADFADNPGGGAYGDSTALLNELLIISEERRSISEMYWILGI